MKSRSVFLLFFLTLFAGFAIESCKHSPSFVDPVSPPPVDTTGKGNGGGNGGGTDTTHKTTHHACSPDSVYFVNDILPIITSNCTQYGCHDTSGHSYGNAKPLYTYTEIMRYVKAFNPKGSELYTDLLSNADDFMPRPPFNPLKSRQDSLINVWISQGAYNNQCTNDVCDTTNITYSGSIVPILQSSCTGCHGGSRPSGSIGLETYQEVLAQVTAHKFLESVTYAQGLTGMPVSTRLSDCDIAAIRVWIQKGAPNN